MQRSLPTLRNTAPAFSIPRPSDSQPPPAAHFEPRSSSTQVAASHLEPNGRVLLVDDEVLIARAYARALTRQGLETICVADAASAVGALRAHTFDAIVCDIGLPDHNGMELLRHVRNSDPDLPLILVTGTPCLETAMEAVTLGAFRYLVKPISNASLVGCIAQARRTRHVARLREQTLQTASGAPSNDTELSLALDRALEPLWIAYQPLITWPHRSIMGYQALVRSDEPSLSLPSPLLRAAESLGRTQQLTLAVHRSVARTARALPVRTRILLPTTANDLVETEFCSDDSSLGPVAKRITLDIANAAALATGPVVQKQRQKLIERGYYLALTGCDQSPLKISHLEALHPQVIKYALDSGEKKPSRGLRDALDWCRCQGAKLVITGVERPDERDALAALGCQSFQDCLFDPPGR